MPTIVTKFSVGDVCYTFNATTGVIMRDIVKEVHTTSKTTDSEISYVLANSAPNNTSRLVSASTEYEQNLYTETEVKDLANTWLINKSVSIFSDAGL